MISPQRAPQPPTTSAAAPRVTLAVQRGQGRAPMESPSEVTWLTLLENQARRLRQRQWGGAAAMLLGALLRYLDVSPALPALERILALGGALLFVSGAFMLALHAALGSWAEQVFRAEARKLGFDNDDARVLWAHALATRPRKLRARPIMLRRWAKDAATRPLLAAGAR